MNKEPLVSIIMPAYNCEKFVADAIKSVIDQVYKNWELIVINDASTDCTKDVITEIAMSDSRILYCENEKNMGVSKTRNRGINLAKGEWIAFLDSDDMWMSTKLHAQIEFLKENTSANLLFTGASYINENGNKASYCLCVPTTVEYKELLKQNGFYAELYNSQFSEI